MNRFCAGLRFLLVAMMSLSFAESAFSEDNTLFYRGVLDDKKAEAPNGAIANADYIDWSKNSAFGAGTVVHQPREGVWSISSYSIANYTFIEGKTGLIVFDTGNNIGMGQAALKIIREHSDKPISAIIYSHHHYTGGSTVFAEASKTGELPVYGHPDLDKNLASSTGELGPMQLRRAGAQLGFYLPHDGIDAAFGLVEPTFDDPKLTAIGHLPVTHPVKDGEEVVIDGVKAVFYHAVSDTRDSVIVHFPDLDVALHNTAVAPIAFSLYTLRGDFYRAPKDMIISIDKLREIDAEIVIGAHGEPLIGDEADRIATLHRDAYAFVYNQSVRGINKGLSPDELAETVRLPEHLTEDPWIFPAYVDWEYNVRGQYRGIVGWFGEDSADLHPPADSELGAVIIEGFGGSDAMIARGRQAMDDKVYNLAAKLMSYVIAAEPDNSDAKQLKADALRQMAQTARSGIQTRNFMLTEALHLEGKIDRFGPAPINFFGDPSAEGILGTPPGTFLKLLESSIDPKKSASLEKIAKVTFTDLKKSWAIHVRRGVAEVTEVVPEKVDATVSLKREIWAEIVLKKLTMDKAISSGKAKVTGSKEDLAAVFRAFE